MPKEPNKKKLPVNPPSNSQPEERTKFIEVQEAEEEKVSPPVNDGITPPGEHAYSLHIEAAKTPRELHQEKQQNIGALNRAISENPSLQQSSKPSLFHRISGQPSTNTQNTGRHKVSDRVWTTLETLASTALIFVVLFFIVNFNAYSTLFFDKLNKLRGIVQDNPYIQKIIPNSTDTQQPLPISANPDQGKKQIPYLNMEVAPPDERIIIPRINKNVPIVKVKTENLIKRDWGALEGDIQNALREGVVHYPGTAEAGENGNVVITGHSSYFSWDPGRFKDVFALLHEIAIGDTVIVYHNQQKYLYQIYERQVVTPDKVDVLTQSGNNRLTLITCTPVGTNLKRLVLFAKPVSS